MIRRNRPVGSVLLALIVGGALSPGYAQQIEASLPQSDGKIRMGVASCASGVCHGSVRPRTNTSVLQNEYVIWSKMDRHRIAYQTLLTNESKEIANKLGLDSAHEARICLDCHSDNVPELNRGEKFLLSDGVGCEACHGGAENYLSAHSDSQVSRTEKLKAGLYPTDQPVARAQLCLSCHMGTVEKMATHDIMGAGHPRLSFELDTFNVLQPKHYTVDEEYKAAKWHGDGLSVWAIGQIESARQSLRLISTRLETAGMFPELALFDCQSCHHPMSERRWKRLTRIDLPPGSVRLNDAHLVMLLAIAKVVNPSVEQRLRTELRGLHGAVATAGNLSGRIAALMDAIEQLREQSISLTRDDARRLLDEIIVYSSSGVVIDYNVAEQAVMAVDMLLSAIDMRAVKQRWLDRVYSTVDDEDRFNPDDFAAVMTTFDQGTSG
ncbi:MAG: multiheme c-type cytochrome [Pseudomonadales bacterium]